MKDLRIHLIGCGGAGYWISLALARSESIFPGTFVLHDGDIIERRNLDRQLFTRKDIGRNKAEALAKTLSSMQRKVEVIPEYLSEDNADKIIEDPSSDLIIISATDNYPARTLALQIVDARPIDSTLLVSPGNGYETAEGYVYMRDWKHHPECDPRVRFPEHLTDTTDDPLRQSCTGEEALTAHPQLALANFEGAFLATKLLNFWINKSDTLHDEWIAGGGKSEEILKTFPTRFEGAPGFIHQENLLI